MHTAGVVLVCTGFPPPFATWLTWWRYCGEDLPSMMRLAAYAKRAARWSLWGIPVGLLGVVLTAFGS